ncbi:DUF4389 domain-containing protein [Polaromonas sp.]|uniref:DUF4389 domain-containing protein n=1 Tax=Polaromonas sp. TaxID=1869339 RepID=UPI001A21A5A0|nr:DUF4389 domain-containing protein [Burkholderiales bacterium]
MNDEMLLLPPPRKLWVRALLMILLAAAFQLAASVLLFVAVVQLVLALTTGAPNARLQQLGRSLGRYLAQIASFESFGSEALPFPFSAWPPGNGQISL